MEWLIDGYNVLLANNLGYEEAARRWLRDQIEACFADKQVRVTIVYDSRGATSAERIKVTSNISEIFVNNADRYIISKVRRSPRPRSFTLVTDDLADIGAAVRPFGPQLMSSPEFFARLQPPRRRRRRPEKPLRETPENIERYLRLFGQE